MNSPRVSVIICTYKREQTLCWTIDDILSQAYREFELIIVDQTPKHEPETEAFLRVYADRLKLIRLEVANLPNARNRGVEAACGDIVVFVDDDIRLGSDLIRRLVTHFDDPEVDAMAPVVVDNRGPEVAMAEYLRKYGCVIRSHTGPRLHAHEVIGACMAIRRSVIQEVGGFDMRLGELHRSASGEDLEFFRRASMRGHRIFVDPSLTVLHLAWTPGGCDVRLGDPLEARGVQLRALVYITRKEDDVFNRSWLWTWVRLVRLCLVRRDMVRTGVISFYRKGNEMREAVKAVRAFVKSDTICRNDP